MHQTLLDCTQPDKSLCCLIGERGGEAFLSFLPCNGGDGKEKTKMGQVEMTWFCNIQVGLIFSFIFLECLPVPGAVPVQLLHNPGSFTQIPKSQLGKPEFSRSGVRPGRLHVLKLQIVWNCIQVETDFLGELWPLLSLVIKSETQNTTIPKIQASRYLLPPLAVFFEVILFNHLKLVD